MIRFVVGPDRRIVPDLAAKLPGRGIWLSASKDVLELADARENRRQDHQRRDGGRQKDKQGGEAQNSPGQGSPGQGSLGQSVSGQQHSGQRHLERAFARAARGPVTVPPDLAMLLQAALVRRIGECLGLSRRAGQAVAGYEKAREALRTGRYRLVLQASDGSQAERERFLSGFGPESKLGAGLTIIDPLPGDVLGRVFGRDHLVHVAIAAGKLAESLVLEAGRLAGLKNGSARAMGFARATGRETASVNDGTGASV